MSWSSRLEKSVSVSSLADFNLESKDCITYSRQILPVFDVSKLLEEWGHLKYLCDSSLQDKGVKEFHSKLKVLKSEQIVILLDLFVTQKHPEFSQEERNHQIDLSKKNLVNAMVLALYPDCLSLSFDNPVKKQELFESAQEVCCLIDIVNQDRENWFSSFVDSFDHFESVLNLWQCQDLKIQLNSLLSGYEKVQRLLSQKKIQFISMGSKSFLLEKQEQLLSKMIMFLDPKNGKRSIDGMRMSLANELEKTPWLFWSDVKWGHEFALDPQMTLLYFHHYVVKEGGRLEESFRSHLKTSMGADSIIEYLIGIKNAMVILDVFRESRVGFLENLQILLSEEKMSKIDFFHPTNIGRILNSIFLLAADLPVSNDFYDMMRFRVVLENNPRPYSNWENHLPTIFRLFYTMLANFSASVLIQKRSLDGKCYFDYLVMEEKQQFKKWLEERELNLETTKVFLEKSEERLHKELGFVIPEETILYRVYFVIQSILEMEAPFSLEELPEVFSLDYDRCVFIHHYWNFLLQAICGDIICKSYLSKGQYEDFQDNAISFFKACLARQFQLGYFDYKSFFDDQLGLFLDNPAIPVNMMHQVCEKRGIYSVISKRLNHYLRQSLFSKTPQNNLWYSLEVQPFRFFFDGFSEFMRAFLNHHLLVHKDCYEDLIKESKLKKLMRSLSSHATSYHGMSLSCDIEAIRNSLSGMIKMSALAVTSRQYVLSCQEFYLEEENKIKISDEELEMAIKKSGDSFDIFKQNFYDLCAFKGKKFSISELEELEVYQTSLHQASHIGIKQFKLELLRLIRDYLSLSSTSLKKWKTVFKGKFSRVDLLILISFAKLKNTPESYLLKTNQEIVLEFKRSHPLKPLVLFEEELESILEELEKEFDFSKNENQLLKPFPKILKTGLDSVASNY